MGDYRVVIGDLMATPIDEVPADQLKYSFVLNGPGGCSFSLPLEHPKCTRRLLDPGKRSVLVYRLSDLVWGGYLWPAAPDLSGGTVAFTAQGWFSRIRRRLIKTALVYTAADQLDIAWALLSYTQGLAGGNLGITRASTALSGITRSITYNASDLKNIGEALTELAGMTSGFDFDITPDRRWVTYYPNRGSVTNLGFELGKNIDAMPYTIDPTNVSSELIGIGNASLLSTVSDAQALADFGLLQDTRSFIDESVQANLDARTNEELRLAKAPNDNPVPQVRLTDPGFGAVWPGDIVRVRANRGYVSFDRSMRITTLEMALSSEGQETATLTFDEVPAA